MYFYKVSITELLFRMIRQKLAVWQVFHINFLKKFHTLQIFSNELMLCCVDRVTS